jgi:hypothetical protein
MQTEELRILNYNNENQAWPNSAQVHRSMKEQE